MLSELLRALQSDRIAPGDAPVERVAQIAPRAIARATLARLRRLGPAANRLAFAVAVLGTSAELRHAAALAGLEREQAAAAADTLAAAAILHDRRPLEFAHPIIRTTIYSEISPVCRAADHGRAARLLDEAGADATTLAPHLLATEPSGDQWLVDRLRTAGRDVMRRGAPHAACTYLERALQEPPAAADRHALLVELGAAETIVLRPAGLERLREAFRSAGDADTRFAAGHELAYALAFADRLDEAVAVGRQLRERVPVEDRERRLVFDGWLAGVAQFAPAHARSELDRLARYEGELTGATAGERLILACLAFRAAHRGDSAARTAQLARLALADGLLLHDHRLGTANYYFAAWALIYADRLDEAERCFDVLVDAARESGSRDAAAGAVAGRCQVLIRQGRSAEAETEGLASLHTAQAIARAILLSALVHTTIERCDPRTWEPFLCEHGLDGELGERAMAGLLLFSRGQMRLAANDPSAALADFEQLRHRDELSGLDTPGIPSRAYLALAHLQLGDLDAARARAAEELDRAERWGSASARAIALRTAALVDGAAIELLRESVAAARGAHGVYERALSLTELGAALRRAGHRRDAREPLREALDLADAGGALRLRRRAHDELLANGARPRRAALRGGDALTASQRRVAQLAADGLGNREIAQALFVTVHTVEGHLTQAYMKLGITSREQLPAALAAPRGA